MDNKKVTYNYGIKFNNQFITDQLCIISGKLKFEWDIPNSSKFLRYLKFNLIDALIFYLSRALEVNND